MVAADGITYEHSWVEEQLKRVPGKSPMTGSAIQNSAPWQACLYFTSVDVCQAPWDQHDKKPTCPNAQVLNPNQDMKSRILSFKQETVKEILSAVPRLANNQALQLLQRGDLAPS